MGIPEAIRLQVIHQNEKRHVWREHDTEPKIADYIRDENVELLAAIEIDDPAFAVASELGDIEYLCIKYEHSFGELPDDLRYIRHWAWQTAALTDLDMGECVRMKVVRNDLKYPESIVNNYPYDEGRAISKRLWQQAGGDVAFSNWYLEVFGGDESREA